MPNRPRILLVEDDADARALFHIHLADYGYAIDEARTGEEAIAKAQAQPPDLVVTDILLPGMNGFEVARQLKQLFSDQFLPVIIATALRDQSSKLLAYRVGADDFLSHPIDPTELGVRVAGLLSLRARHRSLARHNVELAELQRFKDEMSSTVVHDLKNPLSVILANLSWSLAEIDRGDTSEIRGAIEDSLQASRRMLRLLGNLADMARSEAHQLQLQREPHSLLALLQELAQQRRVIALSREIKLEVRGVDIEAPIDLDMITRALENIVDNALRYTPSPGRIELSLTRVQDAAEIAIGNNGPPIPEESRHAIFEKFGRSGQAGRMNLGLGLYFCRLAAETHGGALELDSTAELPTIFKLRVPLEVSPHDTTATAGTESR